MGDMHCTLGHEFKFDRICKASSERKLEAHIDLESLAPKVLDDILTLKALCVPGLKPADEKKRLNDWWKKVARTVLSYTYILIHFGTFLMCFEVAFQRISIFPALVYGLARSITAPNARGQLLYAFVNACQC
jgi:hypothetical protein